MLNYRQFRCNVFYKTNHWSLQADLELRVGLFALLNTGAAVDSPAKLFHAAAADDLAQQCQKGCPRAHGLFGEACSPTMIPLSATVRRLETAIAKLTDGAA
jgi:hypothetical protein